MPSKTQRGSCQSREKWSTKSKHYGTGHIGERMLLPARDGSEAARRIAARDQKCRTGSVRGSSQKGPEPVSQLLKTFCIRELPSIKASTWRTSSSSLPQILSKFSAEAIQPPSFKSAKHFKWKHPLFLTNSLLTGRVPSRSTLLFLAPKSFFTEHFSIKFGGSLHPEHSLK